MSYKNRAALLRLDCVKQGQCFSPRNISKCFMHSGRLVPEFVFVTYVSPFSHRYHSKPTGILKLDLTSGRLLVILQDQMETRLYCPAACPSVSVALQQSCCEWRAILCWASREASEPCVCHWVPLSLMEKGFCNESGHMDPWITRCSYSSKNKN